MEMGGEENAGPTRDGNQKLESGICPAVQTTVYIDSMAGL